MDQRDRKKFEKRLLGEGLNCFRGPKKPAKISNGTERLDLDDLSPMFSNVLGAANV